MQRSARIVTSGSSSSRNRFSVVNQFTSATARASPGERTGAAPSPGSRLVMLRPARPEVFPAQREDSHEGAA